MTGHIVFRADSALTIGAGHVMRCLSLADTLAAKGARITFLTRAHTGHIADVIRARGFDVHLLPKSGDPHPPEDWLGLTAAEEIAQSRTAIDQLKPDWVVLDHYGLGREWVVQCCANGPRVLVIDDLADRAHVGDLVLDQTLNRQASAYTAHWPEGRAMLLGAGFALLNPSFAQLRSTMPTRAFDPGIGKVLIALGGMDADNVTTHLVHSLAELGPLHGLRQLDVVLGPSAPHLDTVQTALNALTGVQATLHIGTPHIAQLMSQADLAIGAGGTMLWERCCLGLPSIALCLAQNQRQGLMAAERSGAIVTIPNASPDALSPALARLAEPAARMALSQAAARLIDGQGCARAAVAIRAQDLTCRRAVQSDAEPVFHWRQTDMDPAHSYSGTTPSLSDHLSWFDTALTDDSRILLIVEKDKSPVGHVRFDRTDKTTARVSIVMRPEVRGQGLGAPTLWAGLQDGQRLGIKTFTAEIHRDNLASDRVFDRLGFVETGQDGDFALFTATAGDTGLPQLNR